MKLTPQHNLILNMLADRAYHCPTAELFMKDDRKRISELNQGGYVIVGDKTCDNPAHHHMSKVKLRRLVSVPNETPFISNEKVRLWAESFKTEVKQVSQTLF